MQKSCLASGVSTKDFMKRKSVQFDVDESYGLGGVLGLADDSSDSSSEGEMYGFIDDDNSERSTPESIFKQPSSDPDLLQWQFKLSQSNGDAQFMEKILSFERKMVKREGHIAYEIHKVEKAKTLALAMLSGQDEMFKAMSKYVSVEEADEWLIQTHPATRCECDDHHKGSLLIRLVRQGRYHMVARALKEGLNPNAVICDGSTQKLWWKEMSEEETFGGMGEVAKLEAVFEKSTPLTAAASLNDLRMLKLLMEHGADPSAHEYSVFGTAARYGHIQFLQSLLDSYNSSGSGSKKKHPPAKDDNFLHMQRACIVSLKNASAEGQNNTIDWLLLRLEQMYDWDVKTPTILGRPHSFGATLLRPKKTSGRFRKTSQLLNSTLPRTSSSKNVRKKSNSPVGSFLTSPATPPPSSRQMVGRVLNDTLNELVKEGTEPGANLRQFLTQGIEKIVELQEKRYPTNHDPRLLLQFYLSATNDENVYTSEQVAARLMSCGLGRFLTGDKSEQPKHTSYGLKPNVNNNNNNNKSIIMENSKKEKITNNQSAIVKFEQKQNKGKKKTNSWRNTLSKKRTMRSVRGLVNGIFASMNRTYYYSPEARFASEKERESAILNAVHSGHQIVLNQLLGVCDDSFVENLLSEAVKSHQKDMVEFLMNELAERKKQKNKKIPFAEKADDVVTLDNEEQKEVVESISSDLDLGFDSTLYVDNSVLANTLEQAISCGDVEIAQYLIDHGATVSAEQLTSALTNIASNDERSLCSTIPLAFQLASRCSFGEKELSMIFDEALESRNPNILALKSILVHQKVPFVNKDQLMSLVHRSCGMSHNDTWRSVAELMIKNFMRTKDSDDSNKDLTTLLYTAETLPHVHVGVLTLLMHSCHIDEDDGDAVGEDGMPSRWL